jgi:hypothetical protein
MGTVHMAAVRDGVCSWTSGGLLCRSGAVTPPGTAAHGSLGAPYQACQRAHAAAVPGRAAPRWAGPHAQQKPCATRRPRPGSKQGSAPGVASLAACLGRPFLSLTERPTLTTTAAVPSSMAACSCSLTGRDLRARGPAGRAEQQGSADALWQAHAAQGRQGLIKRSMPTHTSGAGGASMQEQPGTAPKQLVGGARRAGRARGARAQSSMPCHCTTAHPHAADGAGPAVRK